jgi:hypothetical protein
MMYLTYFSEYTLPRQGVATRVLRQAVAFNPGQSKVVYWLAAMADFGRTRAPLLPHAVPIEAYVNYRLSLDFRPAGQVTDLSSTTSVGEPTGLNAPLTPSDTMGLNQPLATLTYDTRNYLRDQQQAFYEELEARRELSKESKTLNLLPLSITEITRDLAGWTTPQAGALRGNKPAVTLKRGKRAAGKSRND